MQGERADLVITDPPYNVVIDGHATGNGAIRHREFAMASGEMSSASSPTSSERRWLRRGITALPVHLPTTSWTGDT